MALMLWLQSDLTFLIKIFKQTINQVFQHLIRNCVLLDKKDSPLLEYFNLKIIHFIKKVVSQVRTVAVAMCFFPN